MPSPRHRVLFASVILVVLSFAAPAGAHTGFESSEPTDGAVVDGAVAEVTIRFSGEADPTGEGFLALDGTGELRAPDRLERDGSGQVWTLFFEPPLSSGEVGIRWTVQAPDAHPISGVFRFTVAEVLPTNVSPPKPASPPAGAAAPTTSAAPGVDAVQPPTPASPEESEVSPGLDAFLTAPPERADGADALATLGRYLALLGSTLVIGGIVFVVTVAGRRRSDSSPVLPTVKALAVVLVVATAVEAVSQVAGSAGGWPVGGMAQAVRPVLLSPDGTAWALRAGGALLIASTIRRGAPTITPSLIGVPAPETRSVVAVGGPTIAQADHDASSPTRGEAVVDRIDLPPTIAVGVVAILGSFVFDGHTVTEGTRWMTGAAAIVHVGAASVWIGGLVALVLVAVDRHRRGRHGGGLELAARFSTPAGLALGLASLAGLGLTVTIVDQLSDLWTTPWGQLLLVKTGAVCIAAGLGGVNHLYVIPRLTGSPEQGASMLRRVATIEAVILVTVVAITALLVAASAT